MKDVMFVEKGRMAIAEGEMPVRPVKDFRRNTAAPVALKRGAIEGMVHP